ncbi:MAG TPA: Yip1 family protein [Thermoanaerobaculia bacterium]|nr:Yip1 family protein [Thermoanaerobaculia bacterium]
MKGNAASRLWRVFVAPVETFREIQDDPRWVLAFVLLWVLASISAFLLISRVDFTEMVRQQLEAQGQQVPANLESSARMIRGCSTAGTFLGPPIFYLVIAAAFLLFNLLGGELSYKRSLAITVHGLMPQALGSLLAIPVILSRDSFTPEEMQSASFLYSNLGFLAPEGAKPWLLALLGKIDVFTLAALLLLAIGFHVAGKVPRARAFAGVFGLWILAVAVQVGLAAMRGVR